MIRKELQEMQAFLARNYHEAVIISAAALFLILAENHSIYSDWADSLVFYALLPILTVIILLRKNPLDFGLRMGDFRVWRVHVAVACLVALPILLIASRFSSFEEYYSISDFNLPVYLLETIGYQAGWEFMFRGFLLFGLRERFKEASILIQMIPFVLLHIGKPEAEVISTIPTGIYFGYVAYRGNSVWPAFFIHVFINVTFRILVNWC
ncbi:MAG: CPBP family intramembrane metalloprotease [Dehalococcoidia bacterium]|nr:CPBP family intramembrane metalloprotease [Dehalococcoidia bacterium]